MNQPGKGLSNTQTKNSSGVVKQSSGSSSRGDRKDPPKGAQQPGAGFRNSQTRNSRPVRA